MAILDDFTINYDVRKIEHTANTNTWTVNQLYTAVLQAVDDLGGMDDLTPMSAQTPNAYRMINGWWLDISPTSEAHKYLKGGSIDSVGYDADTYNDGVRRLVGETASWHTMIAGDIGKVIAYSGGTPTDSGTILGYDNTTYEIWVRVDDTGDTFANTSTAITVDATASSNLSAASTTGEELFTNVYTIGTLAETPSPQVYIYQDGARISEWSNLDNWDRGAIDVLLQVKQMGTTIGTALSAYPVGFITVFARQYADLFFHAASDVSGGGSVPVALSTAIDPNNTNGSHYLMCAYTTLPAVGETITGGTSGATAEVLDNTTYDWTGTAMLVLGNVEGGPFTDTEALTSTTAVGVTANGTEGGTYITYSNEATGPFTVGSILNGVGSGAKREIMGLQDDGATGKMVLKADVAYDADVTYYTDYAATDTLTETPGGATGDVDALSTSVSSDFNDIGIWFVNGSLEVASSATFTVGKKVTGAAGATGYVLEIVDGTHLLLGNNDESGGVWTNAESITDNGSGTSTVGASLLTDDNNIQKQYLEETAQEYNVVMDLNGRTVQELFDRVKFLLGDGSTATMYPMSELTGGTTLAPETYNGEEYISAYRDEDSTNTYASVVVSPFGSFAGGSFTAARGVWIEDMASADSQNYTNTDEDNEGNSPPNYQTVEVTNLISGDAVLVARSTGSGSDVVDETVYTSHNTNNVAATTAFEVIETIADDVPATGFLRIVKTGDASSNERIAYTSWTNSGSSVFTLGSAHAGGYDNTDTAYAPYIDVTTASSSESVSVVYTGGSVDIVARVRRSTTATKILPFSQASTFISTGRSIPAIRTTDTIIG